MAGKRSKDKGVVGSSRKSSACNVKEEDVGNECLKDDEGNKHVKEYAENNHQKESAENTRQEDSAENEQEKQGVVMSETDERKLSNSVRKEESRRIRKRQKMDSDCEKEWETSVKVKKVSENDEILGVNKEREENDTLDERVGRVRMCERVVDQEGVIIHTQGDKTIDFIERKGNGPEKSSNIESTVITSTDNQKQLEAQEAKCNIPSSDLDSSCEEEGLMHDHKPIFISENVCDEADRLTHDRKPIFISENVCDEKQTMPLFLDAHEGLKSPKNYRAPSPESKLYNIPSCSTSYPVACKALESVVVLCDSVDSKENCLHVEYLDSMDCSSTASKEKNQVDSNISHEGLDSEVTMQGEDQSEHVSSSTGSVYTDSLDGSLTVSQHKKQLDPDISHEGLDSEITMQGEDESEHVSRGLVCADSLDGSLTVSQHNQVDPDIPNEVLDSEAAIQGEDEYEHVSSGLLYVETSFPSTGLDQEEFDSHTLAGCECVGVCGGDCRCTQSYGPPYVRGRLVAGHESRPIVECNDDCSCDESCQNRVAQKGPIKGLKIISIPGKGYGVRTSKLIPKHSFVCEYAGELISTEAAQRRFSQQEHDGSNYILVLREHMIGQSDYSQSNSGSSSINQSTISQRDTMNQHVNEDTLYSAKLSFDQSEKYLVHQSVLPRVSIDDPTSIASPGNDVQYFRNDRGPQLTIIDPTIIGNIGRYINHSCDPNLIVVPLRINSFIPHAALFSCKDISPGQELCYDYGGGLGNVKIGDERMSLNADGEFPKSESRLVVEKDRTAMTSVTTDGVSGSTGNLIVKDDGCLDSLETNSTSMSKDENGDFLKVENDSVESDCSLEAAQDDYKMMEYPEKSNEKLGNDQNSFIDTSLLVIKNKKADCTSRNKDSTSIDNQQISVTQKIKTDDIQGVTKKFRKPCLCKASNCRLYLPSDDVLFQ